MNTKVFNSINKANNPLQEGGKRLKGMVKKNKVGEPLISIITTVKNGEKFLDEAIRSLDNQIYKNFEHIIVDGYSSDNTINIIKKNENKIDYWCSKKDNGIYDGFNLGMQLAKGKYLGFLNSDDTFTPEALHLLNKYLKKNPEIDFVFGSVKKHWGILHGYKPWKIHFSWGFYSSHSTGFFIKTESAQKIGYYNLKYRYSADYDYFYRMIVKHKMKGIGTKKDELFGHFRRGGFSSKISFWDHFLEELKIRKDNNQSVFILALIFVFKLTKNIKRII